MVVACSQAIYVPTAETVNNQQDLNALLEGRDLYIHKCGSCHNLYRPQNFSDEKWASEMPEMTIKAKIDAHQSALILHYLTSYDKAEDVKNVN